jgi:hypothetical protein
MIKENKILMIVAILILGGCRPEKPLSLEEWKTIKVKPVKLTLPADFKHTAFTGINSFSGKLASTDFTLKYNIGVELIQKNGCLPSIQLKEHQTRLTHPDFQNHYQIPNRNRAYLDTVDHKIAIVIVPKRVGKGRTSISVNDCHTGFTFDLEGENLSEAQQKLALQIFETIEFLPAWNKNEP